MLLRGRFAVYGSRREACRSSGFRGKKMENKTGCERFFEQWDRVTDMLTAAGSVCIFTHTSPDGDAIGSATALAIALHRTGVDARVFLDGLPSYEIRYLLGDEAAGLVFTDGTKSLKIGKNTVCVTVDTANRNRLDRCFLETLGDFPAVVKIDHHLPTEGGDYADFELTDPEWAATCEGLFPLISRLFDRKGLKIDYAIAIRLYSGILTDTGRFTYTNTTGNTLRTVAALVDITGSEIDWVAKVNYEYKAESTFRLIGSSFEKMEMHLGGRLVSLVLKDEYFGQARATLDDAGFIVSELMKVIGTDMALLVKPAEIVPGFEPRSGVKRDFKISLRCRPGFDVAAVGGKFGGGGHTCSAGATISAESIEEAHAAALAECLKALEGV